MFLDLPIWNKLSLPIFEPTSKGKYKEVAQTLNSPQARVIAARLGLGEFLLSY